MLFALHEKHTNANTARLLCLTINIMWWCDFQIASRKEVRCYSRAALKNPKNVFESRKATNVVPAHASEYILLYTSVLPDQKPLNSSRKTLKYESPKTVKSWKTAEILLGLRYWCLQKRLAVLNHQNHRLTCKYAFKVFASVAACWYNLEILK